MYSYTRICFIYNDKKVERKEAKTIHIWIQQKEDEKSGKKNVIVD